MVAVAMTSLVATLAIPLMTKAVIDGPVRQRDQNGLWLEASANGDESGGLFCNGNTLVLWSKGGDDPQIPGGFTRE